MRQLVLPKLVPSVCVHISPTTKFLKRNGEHFVVKCAPNMGFLLKFVVICLSTTKILRYMSPERFSDNVTPQYARRMIKLASLLATSDNEISRGLHFENISSSLAFLAKMYEAATACKIRCIITLVSKESSVL